MSIFGYKYIQKQELSAAKQDIMTKETQLNNKVFTDIINTKIYIISVFDIYIFVEIHIFTFCRKFYIGTY